MLKNVTGGQTYIDMDWSIKCTLFMLECEEHINIAVSPELNLYVHTYPQSGYRVMLMQYVLEAIKVMYKS
jgi:hypothetical protein